jgi:hypothetical protein
MAIGLATSHKGRNNMHPSGVLHVAAVAVAFGKAAIGGAGLMLAVLGALNAFLGAAAHTWIQTWAHSGIESFAVPYLTVVGAFIGGLVGITSLRRN